MVKIEDLTFDIRLFEHVFDLLDKYHMLNLIQDSKSVYKVVHAGRNDKGYIHQVRMRNGYTNKGFNLNLHEYQGTKVKGNLFFSIKELEYDSRKDSNWLSANKFSYDRKKSGISISYRVDINYFEAQLDLLICYFASHLF